MKVKDIIEICDSKFYVFIKNYKENGFICAYDSEHGLLSKGVYTKEEIMDANVLTISAEDDWYYGGIGIDINAELKKGIK